MLDTMTSELAELRAELKSLSARLARLEMPVADEIPKPPAPEAISEELMLVLAAAVAAFLGERAHIRQVRIIRSPGWSAVGRVSIQASHILNK